MNLKKSQKLTLALNEITPERLQEGNLKNKKWFTDQVEKCEYTNKLILPVSVDETVTQKIYRKNPHSEKNIVKGQNSSGVNELFHNLLTRHHLHSSVDDDDLVQSCLADVVVHVHRVSIAAHLCCRLFLGCLHLSV